MATEEVKAELHKCDSCDKGVLAAVGAEPDGVSANVFFKDGSKSGYYKVFACRPAHVAGALRKVMKAAREATAAAAAPQADTLPETAPTPGGDAGPMDAAAPGAPGDAKPPRQRGGRSA